MKTCNKCKIIKNLSDFRSAKKGLYGKRGSCIPCEDLVQKKYREKNRDWINKKLRTRYKNMSPSKKKAYIKERAESQYKRENIVEIRKIYNRSDKGIFNRYKTDSKKGYRNYDFKLTFDTFSKIINSNCYYCNIENCRGVDRVNNSIGYVEENCVPCCSRCNEMKNSDSVDSWLDKMFSVLVNMGRIK